MTESECEVEYLDEDADIVQQCFQSSQDPLRTTVAIESKVTPLLVERQEREHKRKKKNSDDSDYYPSDDYRSPSPPSPKMRMKKSNSAKKFKTASGRYRAPDTNVQNLKSLKKIIKENKPLSMREHFLIRKKLSIRIPDYDDPLCLPVKAVKTHSSDLKRLNVWNNVCLEHFKHCDSMLRPERGETKSSTRSVVLRNVANKQTGKIETTIWSKTSVENVEGDKKSEIFQCVLPKYKEKTMLNAFPMIRGQTGSQKVVDEVLLTKEVHKDGETLVVYKPKEAISSVYMLFDKRKVDQEEGGGGGSAGGGGGGGGEEESRLYLREAACCSVCAPCYQTSWRGGGGGGGGAGSGAGGGGGGGGGAARRDKKSIVCPVCARTHATVYNLLAHLRTHPAAAVRRYQRVISAALAEVVEYHYKCRICLEKFESIKKLRQHVKSHQGNEVFFCEVGNHLTK